MTRDERQPYESAVYLPVPEVGDHGSFEREPDYGDPDAPTPELERVDLVDLIADERPDDDNPVGGVL